MLHELIVENYAIVEQARIRFHDGLNILTGETGSGKSIVVDALSLLFGARASAGMVRTGAQRARVSGIFAVPWTPAMLEQIRESGIELESVEDDLIVEREIAANGKSRAFVANRPVTTAFLRQLAALLGDIHGQNEQQLLFQGERQRELLDGYAHNRNLLDATAAAYAQWRHLRERLHKLTENEQQTLRLLDLWIFQRNEIQAVRPQAGEDAALDIERKLLQNVTRLQETASAAFGTVYEAPQSASTQLRQSLKRLDELTRIDPSLQETAAALKQASVLVEEAGYALRDYVGKLEADPKRLEDVESRLAALDRLKRKYGATLEEVIAFGVEVARKADEVENASEHRAALEKDIAAASAEYERAADALTRARASAADRLSKQVEAELKALAMSGTRFAIELRGSAWTAAGKDEILFLVSPNRGEELKPLEKIASGGELSRIALALKTAAQGSAPKDVPTTLVFDEVDAGVGGAAAAAVGRRLKTLSRTNQVLCVTHLAQIAGFADHHYAVSKQERKGRVGTSVEELGTDRRQSEIGRMLSGDHVTPEALRQAQQLIQAGASS